MLIVYYSSNSGGTRRIADNLNTQTVELSKYDGHSPYVLMVPTYEQRRGGFTPRPVQNFLDTHAGSMIGVIGTGNRNFGEHYCRAAHDVSQAYNVPILWRIDIMGTVDDYRTIDAGMTQHWQTLLDMRGLT